MISKSKLVNLLREKLDKVENMIIKIVPKSPEAEFYEGQKIVLQYLLTEIEQGEFDKEDQE